jgi:hypothetical protein
MRSGQSAKPELSWPVPCPGRGFWLGIFTARAEFPWALSACNASRYYSMKSAENSVDIYSVNLNVEKMDPYRAELNHICDEGVIRYE